MKSATSGAPLFMNISSLPLVGLLAVGALAGCSLPAIGPDYRRPTTPTAASYDDASSQLSSTAGHRVARDWWRDFGDPDLDRTIAEVLKENQSLKAALARVEQARALSGEARSAFLPTAGATGLVSREQTSETTTNCFPNSLTTTYRLPLGTGIDGQRTALAVERGAAALAGQRWVTRIAVIRALGGGWERPSSM
jgi:multidrug efflux system outer membrane protein